jgi:hypothetical protein
MRTADDESPTRFDRGYENWLMVRSFLARAKLHASPCLLVAIAA